MISSDDIVIALGANLSSKAGSPLETLSTALRLLERRGVQVKRRSRWWRTPAFPIGTGPEFVNAAAVIRHASDPDAALSMLHAVEAELGRRREARWGARVVDLDLLAYGERILPDAATLRRWIDLPPAEAAQTTPDRLILPHPRLQERAFVLAPMCDVAPDWRHPLLALTARELFDRLPSESLEGVSPIE